MDLNRVVKLAFDEVSSNIDDKKRELIEAVDGLTDSIGVTDRIEKAGCLVRHKSFCAEVTKSLWKAQKESLTEETEE